MGSDKFCLRWNDFEINISSAFRELRDDKDFFDVTLSCDDEQIQAHKVILSACSTFFRNVLRRNPHPHPLLYLKGVKYSDLQSVLNFMYHGEVNVAQEELNSFLAVAEDLRVKGLTQNKAREPARSIDTTTPVTHKNISHPPSEQRTHAHAPVSKRPNPPAHSNTQHSKHTTADDEIQEVTLVKSEPRDVSSTQPPENLFAAEPSELTNALATAEDDSMAYQESYGGYDQYNADEDGQGYDGALLGVANMGGEGSKVWSHIYNGGDGLDQQIESLIQCRVDGGFLCTACGYCNNLKYNMKKHVETHIETPAYPCKYCAKEFKTKNSLNTHTSIHHRD